MSKIGHASGDERGKLSGGTAGDQTGREVYTRAWYNRPWNVILRATDGAIREKIATAMEAACANDLIGYDQNQRNTLLTQARKVGYDPGKVTAACECDCSSLVSVCCMYAGVAESALYVSNNCATTSTLKSRLLATGKFTALTSNNYLTSANYLLRGDILLYEGNHTAVNLEAGSATATTSTAKDYIKLHQAYVNSVTDAGIAVDGIFGSKTLTASIMALQTLLNRLKNASLAVDGIFGPKTRAAVETLKRGSSGVLVHLLQGMLYCRGYDPKGLDYSFGACTLAAVQAFQKDAGIAVDGVVGPVTWRELLTA